jgi:hypothetical protein
MPLGARRRAVEIIGYGLLGGPAVAFFGVLQGRSGRWAAAVLALSGATVVLGIVLLARANRE